MKRIEIFKRGKHTAMNGAVLDFSESDLQAMVAAYDPAIHEAPLVVGHPRHDAPRYGGVGAMSFADGMVAAELQDVVPEFAEWVRKKLFNKVSASLYTPGSPNNPKPGVYYLRHIGFLGAQPPAIKGLNQNGISFSEEEEGIVEFADWSDVQNASLWRRLRDFFIAQFGLEKADSVIPDYAVATLEEEARKEPADELASPAPAPAFGEPDHTPKGDEMSAEEKARLAALEAENADLKKQHAEFAEAEAKRKRDAAHVDHLAFAEGLVKDGKLLPANQAVAVAALDLIAAQNAPLEFGEGDNKASLTVASFQAVLTAFPKVVEFGEAAGNKKGTAPDADDATAIAAAALEFQESEAKAGRTINIAQAVQHVKSVG
ncbi:MAG: peptidase [Pseudomonadota bacterium]